MKKIFSNLFKKLRTSNISYVKNETIITVNGKKIDPESETGKKAKQKMDDACDVLDDAMKKMDKIMRDM